MFVQAVFWQNIADWACWRCLVRIYFTKEAMLFAWICLLVHLSVAARLMKKNYRQISVDIFLEELFFRTRKNQ